MEEVDVAGGEAGVKKLTSRTIIGAGDVFLCMEEVDEQGDTEKREKKKQIELFSVLLQLCQPPIYIKLTNLAE